MQNRCTKEKCIVFLYVMACLRSENIVKNRHENRNQFVFSLDETNINKKKYATQPTNRTNKQFTNNETKPAWEKTLEQLRKHKKNNVTALSVENLSPRQRQNQPFIAAHKNRNYGHAINTPDERINSVKAKQIPSAISSKPSSSPQQSVDVLLDPVLRERAYRTYLQQWQQKHTMEIQQQESALNDTSLLIQEDWLAAQNCLQSSVDENIPSSCTISLQGNQASIVVENKSAEQYAEGHTKNIEAESNQPVIHVHMHVIEPRGTANRGVACISEQALMQQLSEKLRPHLADVLAGMVRVAVQKHTAGLVTTLQRELLAEVPSAVDDVLQHNLIQVMNNIKRNQRLNEN